MQNTPQSDPADEIHSYWSTAFDLWNAGLFNDQLPKVALTFTRKARALGFFRPDALKDGDGNQAHMIAMNPQYFHVGDKYTHSVFVHEMAHLWRQVLGPPNRKGGKGSRGYHDKVWGSKMLDIGLQPSHTGRPGGRETGVQMMHYIVEGGLFDLLYPDVEMDLGGIVWKDTRPAKFSLDPIEKALDDIGVAPKTQEDGETPEPEKPRSKDRIKFSCRGCGLNAWAKPTARLACIECETEMTAAK